MKFFNWMHNKFNGGQDNKRQNAAPAPRRDKRQETRQAEFSDWPNGLLTIGTFGNVSMKENPGPQSTQQNQESEIMEGNDEHIDDQQSNSSPDLTEFTQEEIGQLQKELKQLLTKKPAAAAKAENATEIADLPLDRFLNCPSSLEVDRRISNRYSTNSDDINEEDIDRTIRVILGRCKDIRMESKKKGIGKKSVSFLLKKMFVCSSGFAPTPSLRDTFQESRMEKLLRTMLSKKIHTQNSSRASSSKKFIEDRRRPRVEEEDLEERGDKSVDKCKWVKTDSEFIVLEV